MKKVYILILAVVLGTSFSCTKIKLNKLEGTWENVPLTKTDSTITYWTFNTDDSFIISTYFPTLNTTVSDTGGYSFSKNGAKYQISIFEMDGNTVEGQHTVDKLTKDILKIMQTSTSSGGEAYEPREFTKATQQ